MFTEDIFSPAIRHKFKNPWTLLNLWTRLHYLNLVSQLRNVHIFHNLSNECFLLNFYIDSCNRNVAGCHKAPMDSFLLVVWGVMNTTPTLHFAGDCSASCRWSLQSSHIWNVLTYRHPRNEHYHHQTPVKKAATNVSLPVKPGKRKKTRSQRRCRP